MFKSWHGWITFAGLFCMLALGPAETVINQATAQDQPALPGQTTPAQSTPVQVAPAQTDAPAEPAAPAPVGSTVPVDSASSEAKPTISGPSLGPTAERLADAEETHMEEPDAPHIIWILPFVILLGSIALGPLINQHWWEHNYHYVAIAMALITAGYFFFLSRDVHPWLHEMQEYVSFIALLASLYVVSGGIVIHVGSKATPAANTMLLFVGAVIANIVGTTGASMLLIRPFIRMNKDHIKPYHVVFFIFVVSNVGGALTPIGDPPLFLGYLQGIPFFWTLTHLWPLWAVVVGAMLAVFYFIDRRDHGKQERTHSNDPGPKVSITGFPNFLFIGLILIGVFRPSMFKLFATISGGDHDITNYLSLLISREVLMIAACVGSLVVTPKLVHERNQFTWGPIKEVAIIFIGIFSTMVPALMWLDKNAEKMPIRTPGQYYFTTGALSSVLDNAPTYLVFLKTRLGMLEKQHILMVEAEIKRMTESQTLDFVRDDKPQEVVAAIDELIVDHTAEIRSGSVTRRHVELSFLLGNPALNAFIVAVSAGAVFFGAATYIGNGPNFMVKSIAESSGVKMPSFFGYVIRFSLPFLVPVLVVIWLIFFVILG